MRTKKVVGDKTIEYYYSGDLLVAQFDGETLVRFIYSPSGEVIGFTCDMVFPDGEIVYGDYCYYVKNAQGDITGFYSMFLSIYREYTYDAWGNVTGVYNENGRPVTNPNDTAFLNPLRYRGYYYDEESGLYYLKSRYYNPEWGRFISADAFADTGQGALATNMYAYCENNAVNRVDYNGNSWEEIKTSLRNLYNDAKAFCGRVFGFGNNVTFSDTTEDTSFSFLGLFTVSSGTKSHLSCSTDSLNKPISFFSKMFGDTEGLFGFGGGVRFNFSKQSALGIEITFSSQGIGASLSFKNNSISKEFSTTLNIKKLQLDFEVVNAASWENMEGASYTRCSIGLWSLAMLSGVRIPFGSFSVPCLAPAS